MPTREQTITDVLERLQTASDAASEGEAFTCGTPWFRNVDGVLVGSPDPHAGTLIATLDTGDLDLEAGREVCDSANAAYLAAAWNFGRLILGSPKLLAALREGHLEGDAVAGAEGIVLRGLSSEEVKSRAEALADARARDPKIGRTALGQSEGGADG